MLSLQPPFPNIIAKMRKKTVGHKRPCKVSHLLANSPNQSATAAASSSTPSSPSPMAMSSPPASIGAPVLVVALSLATLPVPQAPAILGGDVKVEAGSPSRDLAMSPTKPAPSSLGGVIELSMRMNLRARPHRWFLLPLLRSPSPPLSLSSPSRPRHPRPLCSLRHRLARYEP
jgi:hypothetical protein